jgi:RNA polymerase sigma-70 factor (ECF subfamily)
MSESAEPRNGPAEPSESFAVQMTTAQGALYAYVCTLLGGSRDASDVLQETNLVLWRKAAEFDPQQSFSAWARKIAFLQVMAFRKKRATDRHQFNFNEDSLGRIAARLETQSQTFAQRVRLLDECIEKLPDYQRELVRMRYADRLGVAVISRQLEKSENSVAAALYRARTSLVQCVETHPAIEDKP